MLKKPTELFAYFGVCISCFLMSEGLGILLNTGFESGLTVKTVMLQILLTSLAMTVLLYNRFTGILAGLAAAAGVIYCANKLNITEIEELVSFVDWCLAQMPKDSPWYSAEILDLMHKFMNIGICAVIFLVGRTPYRSRLTAFICIALISCFYLFALDRYNRIVILLIFTGVFSVFAIDKFEHRRHFGGRKTFVALGKRWIVPLTSIILCLFISGSSLIVLDNDKRYDTRNRFCSDIAADVQSFTGVYTKEQRDLTVSLYDLGLQSNKDYIGGDLPQMEHSLLAVTDLNRSFNVKVTSFDTFTGKSWSTSFEDNYRINGPFKKEQRRYLSNNIINDISYIRDLGNLLFSKKVRFTLNISTFYLPTVGQTYRYTENTESMNPNLFNGKGQLFSYFGQGKGYSYTLDTLHFNTNARLSQKEAVTIAKLAATPDPIYTRSFVDRYTKCPVRFGENINKILEIMKINPNSKFDTARKVTSFFSKENGYTYADKGLEYDSESNIINKLFSTKKGHCVYYSTTAIAILRHFKVPSRLAAGYRTVKYSNNVQIIDGYYPYCWVECYFPNLGWVSFDPSPENKIEFPSDFPSFKNKANNSKGKAEPSKVKQFILNIPKVGKASFNYLWIVLVIAVLYFIARGFWASRLYGYNSVVRRFEDRAKQCEFYLRDIRRQLGALGFKEQAYETFREQVLKACETLEVEDKAPLIAALKIGEELYYGNKLPSSEDVAEVCEARAILEGILKNKMKLITYVLKRKVFLPVLYLKPKKK